MNAPPPERGPSGLPARLGRATGLCGLAALVCFTLPATADALPALGIASIEALVGRPAPTIYDPEISAYALEMGLALHARVVAQLIGNGVGRVGLPARLERRELLRRDARLDGQHLLRGSVRSGGVGRCLAELAVVLTQVGGHRKLETTMRYSLPTEADLANAMDRLTIEY